MGSSEGCGQCANARNPIRRCRGGAGRRTRHHNAWRYSRRRITIGHDWYGCPGASADRRVHVAGQRSPDYLGASGYRKRKPTVSGEFMKQEYDFSKGKRGAVVPVAQGKTRVTIRLDDDLLEWFRNEVDKAGGGNYQTLINLALRDFVSRSREPLESTLRRVLREELKRAG